MPSWRRNLLVALALASAGALLWAALAALRPLPERTLTMATGPEGSAYRVYAERYRALLAKQGVTVRLVPTEGALDNLTRLRDPGSGVSAAFVQAGTTTEEQSPGLVSLGTMFYEPLWIFCRCDTQGLEMKDVLGRHVSIGPAGGATHDLALRLMRLNGLDPAKVRLEEYSPERAAEELEQGRIDVAIIDTAWDSPAVRRLLAIPLVGLVYPLTRFLPEAWRWEMGRRLRRMYRELLAIEREMRASSPGPSSEKLHQRLDALEARALGLRLPDSFAAAGYELKQNIRFVQERYRA